jgi:hypothetical protein
LSCSNHHVNSIQHYSSILACGDGDGDDDVDNGGGWIPTNKSPSNGK